MTKLELRRLRALVRKLEKYSGARYKQAKQLSENAGHSNDERGTGDEGWSLMFTHYGAGDAYSVAASELKNLLARFGGKNDT